MKLNYKRTFFVGLAFMSICAFWQVYDNAVSLILKNTFHVRDSYIGVVLALDNILALFMLPLFGKLSDKTRTKIGRRMPYILGGTAMALLCIFLMPLAERLHNLVLFFVGLGLVLIAMATYRSPAVALMPDVTPKPLRSQANAVINLMGAVGGMVMLVAMNIFPITGENPLWYDLFHRGLYHGRVRGCAVLEDQRARAGGRTRARGKGKRRFRRGHRRGG